MKSKKLNILLAFLLITLPLLAQDYAYKYGVWEHKIVAGFNLGATTPVPLPEEIRTIKEWRPQFTPQIGYNVLYRIDETQWGIGSGILLNLKGMNIKDRVKYMYTRVTLEEGSTQELEGYFVGKNETTVNIAYITIPVYASFDLNENWNFRAGGYVSYKIKSEFGGTVSDGYMRVGTPVGEKIEITQATFNFDDNVRKGDFGLTIGAERRVNDKFGIYGNMDWGLRSIFHPKYRVIEFGMYNVYLTLGLTYRL